MSLIARIVLLVLAVPFVLAHGDDCGRNQFKWPAKDVCLPNGGPSNPSSPPANTDCAFNWSWHTGKGCCAPHNPPNSLPPPQCPNGWNWNASSYRCTPPTRPAPPPSSPSRSPGDHHNDGHGGHRKRDYRSRNVAPCPKGLSACPVSSLIGGDYECVDILVDLDNCGGCATTGEGQNCDAIPGVWNVGCEESACKIYTCADGYILSKDGKSCNAL